MLNEYDRHFFRQAMYLADRGLGNSAPNPSVGCVITRNNSVLSRGWTQPGGRPHAEAMALSKLDSQGLSNATVYVTLEPCSHTGKTPPCAQSLIKPGIGRVVVGPTDPDPRVSGRGIEMLRSAGVTVDRMDGPELTAAEAQLKGFFLRITNQRPLVTVKLASTLDGKLATARGHSHWITGDLARRDVHMVRSQHDSIMVGARTATLDNPSLGVRLPGMENRHKALRVILDTHLRVPLTHTVVKTAREHPTLILTKNGATKARILALRDSGVFVDQVSTNSSGFIDVKQALRLLAKRGHNRLLVEGGARLAASLFKERLVDRLIWYRAPKLVGSDGLSGIAQLNVRQMAESINLRVTAQRILGCDSVEEFDVRQ